MIRARYTKDLLLIRDTLQLAEYFYKMKALKCRYHGTAMLTFRTVSELLHNLWIMLLLRNRMRGNGLD
jgi:hypothetical protein